MTHICIKSCSLQCGSEGEFDANLCFLEIQGVKLPLKPNFRRIFASNWNSRSQVLTPLAASRWQLFFGLSFWVFYTMNLILWLMRQFIVRTWSRPKPKWWCPRDSWKQATSISLWMIAGCRMKGTPMGNCSQTRKGFPLGWKLWETTYVSYRVDFIVVREWCYTTFSGSWTWSKMGHIWRLWQLHLWRISWDSRASWDRCQDIGFVGCRLYQVGWVLCWP